jgi:hypothetical protein
MKVEFFEQCAERRRDPSEKRSAGRFEGILTKTVLAALSLMILSQIVLSDPSIRSSIYEDYYSEGKQLKGEAWLFTPCKMELTLCSLNSCTDLAVLVNGEQRAVFMEKKVLLDLKQGDIVELDASALLTVADVQISSVSGNIKSLLGKTITVTDGICRVARIETE